MDIGTFCPECALMHFDVEEYRVSQGEFPEWMEEEDV
jgi:hypothetical protein